MFWIIPCILFAIVNHGEGFICKHCDSHLSSKWKYRNNDTPSPSMNVRMMNKHKIAFTQLFDKMVSTDLKNDVNNNDKVCQI